MLLVDIYMITLINELPDNEINNCAIVGIRL